MSRPARRTRKTPVFHNDSTATFVDDGTHRLSLYRRWGRTWKPQVTFVGLNPSTAGADVDDPTIRKCAIFAETWGFSRLRMVNLHTIVSTDPDALIGRPIALGEHRRADEAIAAAVDESDLVVAAWGAHPAAEGRALDVVERGLLGSFAVLGLTKSGAPRHPLYMRADTVPLDPLKLMPVPLPRDSPSS
jgi:hypothetical protein